MTADNPTGSIVLKKSIESRNNRGANHCIQTYCIDKHEYLIDVVKWYPSNWIISAFKKYLKHDQCIVRTFYRMDSNILLSKSCCFCFRIMEGNIVLHQGPCDWGLVWLGKIHKITSILPDEKKPLYILLTRTFQQIGNLFSKILIFQQKGANF